MIFELILEDEELDGIFAISLVSKPAIESDFVYFDKEEIKFAAIDTEKRLVMGPILIPDKKIIRVDGEGKTYHVFFKASTIKRLSEKYLQDKNTTNVTLEHDTKVDGVSLVESWIKESQTKDKSALYNLNVPVGSWIGTFKIDNDEIWNDYVKNGKVAGFSIEGLFGHELVAAAKEEIWMSKEITELSDDEAILLLKKIKELLEAQPSVSSTYAGEPASGSIAPALLAATDCPPATQDIKLNLVNRQNAIDTLMYGPLDIKNPGDYWDKIAEKWGVPVEEAKGEICGNCAAFDVRKQMLSCIAEGLGTEPSTDPYDVIEAGELGYCRIAKFKCNANRSCFAHIDGGPITD
jgi:hypothetical protein